MFIPAGYANITWIGTQLDTGQEAMTSIGVLLEAADPGDVLTGAGLAWNINIGPSVGEEWGAGIVRLVIGTSDPNAPLTFEQPFADFGQNTADTAPPQVAWLVRKLTMTGGRKGRGRMYFVGPAEDGIDGAGNFSTSQHDFLQAAITSFGEDLESIDGVEGLYLFHTDPNDDPSAIVSLVSERMVATQRRRLRG